MKQIRNVFFACLNHSTLARRVGTNEKRHKTLDETCARLDEVDKQMEKETKEMHQSLQDKVTKWRAELADLQRQNDRRMGGHDTKLANHGDVLR